MKLIKELIQRCALNRNNSYFLISNKRKYCNISKNNIFPKNISQYLLYTQQVRGLLTSNRNYSDKLKHQNSPKKQKLSVWDQPSDDKGNDAPVQKWWQTTYEFKILASLLFGLMSYLFTSHTEKRRAIKKCRLDHVNQQIKLLYGPLYGNRLIQQKTYRTVMGKHGGLKNYLKIALENKDAEMLRRWRSFVLHTLYPLDKEAEALICKNAHLIMDKDFPKAFHRFLSHVARLQFVMEHWKSQDGKLEKVEDFTSDDFLEENNASCEPGAKEMLNYVEKTFKTLKEAQEKLEIEVKEQDSDKAIVSHLKLGEGWP